MLHPPIIVLALSPPALIDHVLTSQSGTSQSTLVVCSTRDAFLHDLLDSLQPQAGQHGLGLERLMAPTLHNLFTARHVKVVFCTSVQTLLAYFTAYAATATRPRPSKGMGRDPERIVLVNPLRLHASTPSFSAQGLSRTFAAAVEAASRAEAALVVAECVIAPAPTSAGETVVEQGLGNDQVIAQDEAQADPWEQQVSILNVSARRFGSGNTDRAWAGRTVTAKRIAARWFRFCKLGDPSDHHEPD